MLDEMVNIPVLLWKAGLVPTRAAGHHAVGAGKVYIERWNIGLGNTIFPRWVLRGVTITVGDKSARVSECGYKIRRSETAELV